jgi:hypothetical protein
MQADPNAVQFVHRFSRQAAEHTARELALRPVVLGLVEQEGSGKYDSNNTAERILLYPVERIGNSGSSVYYFDIYRKGLDVPRHLIAKFQDPVSWNKEVKGARIANNAGMCTYFQFPPSIQSITTPLFSNFNETGIAYPISKLSNYTEFRDVFLSSEEFSSASCGTCLREALSDWRVARPESDSSDSTMYEEYVHGDADYAREHRSRSRLSALIDSEDPTSGPVHLAQSALFTFDRLAESAKSFRVPRVLVHGDLHARNLLVSRDNIRKSELIDFAWCHFGHWAKDYALMEATVKYMLLPELHRKQFRSVEVAPERDLITLRTVRQLETYLAKVGLQIPSSPPDQLLTSIFGENALQRYRRSPISRTYSSIYSIRKAALDKYKKVVDASGSVANMQLDATHEYQMALFFVSFGQISFPVVEHSWVLLGLKAIGEVL